MAKSPKFFHAKQFRAIIWILKNHRIWFWNYIIFRAQPLPFLWRTLEPDNHQSWLLQEPTLDGFDETDNELVVLWLIWIFFKFFENHGCIYQDWAFEFWRTMIIHPRSGLWFLRIVIMNLRNHLDNHQRSVLVSNSGLTLVPTSAKWLSERRNR